MIENNPIKYIVDTQSGEIENEIYSGDRLSIRREKQDDYKENHVINFNNGKSFVKIYDEVVPILEKYLTLPEFKFVICLTPHVSFEDCIIRKTHDRTSKILGMKDIAEIHGYKYDYVRKIMSSLIRKGVIGKHETGAILKNADIKKNTVYTVNPYIYFRGSDMITPVHSFYSSSGWEELISKDGDTRKTS